MGIGREFYQLLRLYGGLAVEYLSLSESDFTAAAGAAYVPPEEGTHRRIVDARVIQFLSQCPVVVETFQTSSATLRLPANTAAEDTNDSGNGRIFIIKNSGVGAVTIENYLGTTQFTLVAGLVIQVVGNSNNSWDFIFTAKNTWFDPANNPGLGFVSTNVQGAIEELAFTSSISAAPGFTWGRSGTTTQNTWLLNDSVPSNTSGRTVFLYNASVTQIFVANQDPVIIKLGVYHHDGDGLNMTLLGTVTTAAQRSNAFTVAYLVPYNKQLALRVQGDTPNSAKNIVVGLLLTGSITP